MRIERIERRPRTQRADVHAGGTIVATVALAVVLDAGLCVGDDLTPAAIERLRYDDDRRRAIAASLRLVAQRPRSEAELRERLVRKGFGRQLIDATIARMRELGYVDDAAFAEYWTEARQSGAPRSRRMLEWELRTKGIARETATEAAAAVDEDEAAYRAIERRARALDASDDDAFASKLSGMLLRRGFRWGTVQRAIERVRLERDGHERPLA